MSRFGSSGAVLLIPTRTIGRSRCRVTSPQSTQPGATSPSIPRIAVSVATSIAGFFTSAAA